LELARKERDQEIRLKQELRRLKQEDLQKTAEQLKRQEHYKKL
jgi:hypothetical protein